MQHMLHAEAATFQYFHGATLAVLCVLLRSRQQLIKMQRREIALGLYSSNQPANVSFSTRSEHETYRSVL